MMLTYLERLVCLIALATQVNVLHQVYGKEHTEEELEFIKKSGLKPEDISPDAVFIKPPKYTDEEERSSRMPKQYQCDACHVMAYQLRTRFEAAEKKKGGPQKLLLESDAIEILEDLCKDDFKSYGVMTDLTGHKYLVGDGLDTKKSSGSIDNGSLWTKRLRNLCLEILDSHDEEELYHLYKSSQTLWTGGHVCAPYCGYESQKTEL